MLKYVNRRRKLSLVKDDTPWLDEDEMSIWRNFLEASGRVTAQIDESLKKHGDGLTLDDYEVLVHLSEAEPARLRMTELSHRLLHSQSRLTQRIDRLTKRGLVCREKCVDDGRGTFAVLTAEGLAAIQQVAPRHVRDVRELLIDVIEPNERATIAAVLERLAHAAREAELT